MAETLSSFPILRTFFSFPRYPITEVREITFKSPIFDRLVRMSSWMPSAKKALSLSSLKFSNGKTAIDLSTFFAATCGRRKNPATIATVRPTAPSRRTFRLRCGLFAPPAMGSAGVAWMPEGVTSKAQARMRAMGKPTSNRTITKRSDQSGNSHAGKTADAS